MLYLEIWMLMCQNALSILGRVLVPGLLYALLTDMEGIEREQWPEEFLRTSIPLSMGRLPT